MIRYVCMISFWPSDGGDMAQLYRLIVAHDVEDADRQLADFADRHATAYAHGLRLAPDEIVYSVAQPDLEALYRRLRPSALFGADEGVIAGHVHAGLGKHYSVLEAVDEAAPRPEAKPDPSAAARELGRALARLDKSKPKPKARPKPKPKTKSKARPKPKSKAKTRPKPKPKSRPRRR